MKKSILKIAAVALCAVFALGILCACENEPVDKVQNEDIYAIKAGAVTVELGKKADSTLDKLGEPMSEQNTGNCGGLGETVRYEYSSFVMVVVDYEDGGKIIDQITLKNDGAETSKGIYIGSSEAAVREKYGEPDGVSGKTLKYESDDKLLEFGITDGAVSSIVFRCK